MSHKRWISCFLIVITTLTLFSSSSANGQDPEMNPTDLSVERITFEDPQPDNLMEGDRAKISIKIKNLGNASITTPWVIRITDNDRKIKEEVISKGLNPSDVMYYNFSYELKRGEREIVVMADYNNDLNDTNLENNRLDTAVIVEEGETIVDYWCLTLIPPLFLMTVGSIIFLSIRYHKKRQRNEEENINNIIGPFNEKG